MKVTVMTTGAAALFTYTIGTIYLVRICSGPGSPSQGCKKRGV